MDQRSHHVALVAWFVLMGKMNILMTKLSLRNFSPKSKSHSHMARDAWWKLGPLPCFILKSISMNELLISIVISGTMWGGAKGQQVVPQDLRRRPEDWQPHEHRHEPWERARFKLDALLRLSWCKGRWWQDDAAALCGQINHQVWRPTSLPCDASLNYAHPRNLPYCFWIPDICSELLNLDQKCPALCCRKLHCTGSFPTPSIFLHGKLR